MSNASALSLVFDALIAVLLVATIAYAVMLNRKLSVLRDAKAEMDVLVGRLSRSAELAGSGLESVKQHAQQAGDGLQRTAHTAQALADELVFLIDKGNSLAARLDGAIGGTRAKARPPRAAGTVRARGDTAPGGPEPQPAPVKPRPTAAEVSPREAELRRALQGMR